MTHTVFLDTETTHLSPDIGDAWDFGFIVENHPLPEYNGEWEFLIPEVPITAADPGALRVGRFLQRTQVHRDNNYFRAGRVCVTTAPVSWQNAYVAEAVKRGAVRSEVPPPTWNDARFARWIAAAVENAVIVGVRPEFDLPFITKYVAAHHGPIAPNYHTIDVAQVTLGRIVPTPRTYSSHQLSEHVGCPLPPTEERHTALGDARWARRWLAALDGAVHGQEQP